MNHRLRPLLLTCLLTCLAAYAQAQGPATASANAAVRIEVPVGISKGGDLTVREVGLDDAVPGTLSTIVLDPKGAGYSVSGPLALKKAPKIAPARFALFGETELVYAVSLPEGPVTVSNGSQTMEVSHFTSHAPTAGRALFVAATLQVAAGQPKGLYVSRMPVPVTINYN